MQRRISLVSFLILTAAIAIWGCSGDPSQPGGSGGTSGTGILDGQIGAGDFEYVTRSGGTADRPLTGPFIIRGRNIHYVDSIGALSVDLSVQNAGRVNHYEPIGLTFVRLLPEVVQVLNPDNDEHGDGAAIVFSFENDDGMWIPGERSLPRTVQFEVDRGTAIGFVARIDVGMAPDAGSIGGIVWHDANRDGMMDPGEEGITDATVALMSGDATAMDNANVIRRARTAQDGSYRFDGLQPGFYTVAKISLARYLPTTPSVLHVVLTPTDDGVSDFLMANFGCVPQDTMPPDTLGIHPGAYVEVAGDYVRDENNGYVVAREIKVAFDDERLARPLILRKQELRGPVTGINRDADVLAVMGAWISFAPDSTDSMNVHPPTWTAASIPIGDVKIGDRVRAFVHDAGPDHRTLLGIELRKWQGNPEKVHGYVQRVGGAARRPDQLVVLRTRIVVTPNTRIHVLIDNF